jgi:hypothetical protein
VFKLKLTFLLVIFLSFAVVYPAYSVGPKNSQPPTFFTSLSISFDKFVNGIFYEFNSKVLRDSRFGEALVDLIKKELPSFSLLAKEHMLFKVLSILLLGLLAFSASIILLKPISIVIVLMILSCLFVSKLVSRRYIKTTVFSIALAAFIYPMSAHSDAPNMDDWYTPSNSLMIDGDFGFALSDSESVRQKYDSGFIKSMPAVVKRKRDARRSTFEATMGPMNIQQNFDDATKLEYENVYQTDGTYIFFISGDYHFWQGFMGRLGINTMLGIARDGGFGTRSTSDIADASSQGVTVAESSKTYFSFTVFPIELGLTYRALFHPKMYVAPFGRAAIGYYPFVEARADKNQGLYDHYGACTVYTLTGGVEINITAWNKRVQRTFMVDYGIFDVHLNMQVKLVNDIRKSGNISFQNRLLLAGLTFEY